MNIFLTALNSNGNEVTIQIPVLPSIDNPITYKTGGRYQEHEILNKCAVQVPNGYNPLEVAFQSFFPSMEHPQMGYILGARQEPNYFHNNIEYWRSSGKKVKVQITESPINDYFYIQTYEMNIQGPYKDYYYSIEFKAAIDIEVTTSTKKKNKTSGNGRTNKNAKKKTHTIKSGDTLWGIAKKYYKNGAQWKKIYNANKSVIEAKAKKNGRKSSSNGNWIYPGTKIVIP